MEGRRFGTSKNDSFLFRSQSASPFFQLLPLVVTTVYLHLTLSLWPSSFPLAWQLCLHYLLFTCPKPSQPCLFSFLISSNCCPVPLMYSLIISSMLDTPYDNPLSFCQCYLLQTTHHSSSLQYLVNHP